MKKCIPLVLCASIACSGCANIQDDGTRTRVEGLGAGAGIGALIGQVAGGSTAATLLGTAIGGLIGLAVGDYIAIQKEDYASREEWLDACINRSLQVNEELVAHNEQLKKDMAELDKQSTALAASYKRNKANSDAMKAEYKKIDARKQEVDQLIAGIEGEIAQQKTVVDDARAEDNHREADIIETEIALMEKRIAELRQDSEKLASMSMRVSI